MKCQYCAARAEVNIYWYWGGRVDDEVVCLAHLLEIKEILSEIDKVVSTLEGIE